MSDLTIRIDPPEARAVAGDIEVSASNIRNAVQSATDIINHLKANWNGESADAFFNRYLQGQPEREEWDRIVLAFATLIREAADDLEAEDRRLANEAGQL